MRIALARCLYPTVGATRSGLPLLANLRDSFAVSYQQLSDPVINSSEEVELRISVRADQVQSSVVGNENTFGGTTLENMRIGRQSESAPAHKKDYAQSSRLVPSSDLLEIRGTIFYDHSLIPAGEH